jgi:large subunit ribosomal protein L25
VEVKLKAVSRIPGTRGELNVDRTNGKIPATFYGKMVDPVSMFVELPDFLSVIHGDAGTNVILELEIKDAPQVKGKQTVIIKDMQRDPIKGDILHIDFMKISMAEEIQATIPVVISGESTGVKLGGVLQHTIREVNIKCLPGNMPDQFELDVTELDIGDNIHVSDLPQMEGVEVLDDQEEILVSVVPPTKVEEPVVAEEEELEEEEAAAEPEVIGEKKEEEAEQE